MNLNIQQKDRIFIDTNILVYLFAPSINSKKTDIDRYSSILDKLIENNNELYINSLVVSEFINLCLRNDFNNLFNKDGNKNFKRDYRNSIEYITALDIILNQLEKILEFTIQIDDKFSKMEIIKEYNKDKKVDFNDLIIYKNVIDNKFKLLTNDKDFQKYHDIHII